MKDNLIKFSAQYIYKYILINLLQTSFKSMPKCCVSQIVFYDVLCENILFYIDF